MPNIPKKIVLHWIINLLGNIVLTYGTSLKIENIIAWLTQLFIIFLEPSFSALCPFLCFFAFFPYALSLSESLLLYDFHMKQTQIRRDVGMVD